LGWNTNPAPESGGASGPGELELTITAGDTTPAISGAKFFVVKTAVTITDFDEEPSSGIKEIRVRSTVAGVIITHTNGTIELPLGLNITLDAGGWIILEWNGTLWSYKGHENQEGEEGL